VLEQTEFAGKGVQGARGLQPWGDQRQTQLIAAFAHQLEHCLDRRWIRLQKLASKRGENGVPVRGLPPNCC